MIISVASGKGGTGKTTVSTNLAYCLQNVTLVDCDVEEPNAHIFLKPRIEKDVPVYAKAPRIHGLLCNLCGQCSEFCRYNAIAVLQQNVLVFPELCHHCGGCAIACPQNAIAEEDIELGCVEVGFAGEIRFIHGVSEVGLPEAVPVIRKEKELMGTEGICIIDVPAGTSCLMVEAIRDCDFCILVTEPTPFGLHDLKLAVNTVRELNKNFGVVINRYGIGNEDVLNYCQKENIPILARIPNDRRIAELYSRGELIYKEIPEVKQQLEHIENYLFALEIESAE
jgi:MinD superfamily P-loop ATPase